jgi:hypothetical protein
MASAYLIRLGKVKGKNGVLIALKHNKRVFQRESGARLNIDPLKTDLNYALTENESPEAISKKAEYLIFDAGIRNVRKNAVMAVEVLFSLPIKWHQHDSKDFFIDCFNWVKMTFSGELLSFDVHLDESAPHAHALILPLVEGRMKGSDMVGNKANLIRLVDSFYSKIAIKYGMVKPIKSKPSANMLLTLEQSILEALKNDSVLKSIIWSVVRDKIKQDPVSFAQILSISSSGKENVKSFVDFKRSKGRGRFVK